VSYRARRLALYGSAYMGDPGLFSGLKKLVKGAVRIGGGLLGVGGGGGGSAPAAHCPPPTATSPAATDPFGGLMQLLMMQSMMAPPPRRRGPYGMYMGDPGLKEWAAEQFKRFSPTGAMPNVTEFLRTHPQITSAIAGIGGGLLGGGLGATIGARVGGYAASGPRPTKAGGMTYRRRPRMQVTNTRALRRALRRTSGFAKIARQVLRTSKTFKSRPRFTRRKRRAA